MRASPRSETVSEGWPAADRAAVGDEGFVSAAKSSGCCCLKSLLEHAPDLLLPLEEDLHADGRGGRSRRAERTDVDEEVRLRVGGAAPVDRAVALDRLERRGAPLALVPGGDDVVMRIEQNRGRSRRAGKLAPDDRSGIGKMKGVELLQPCVTEEPDHEVVRLEERPSCLLRKVRGGDRRNCHQLGQVGLQRWHQR